MFGVYDSCSSLDVLRFLRPRAKSLFSDLVLFSMIDHNAVHGALSETMLILSAQDTPVGLLSHFAIYTKFSMSQGHSLRVCLLCATGSPHCVHEPALYSKI